MFILFASIVDNYVWLAFLGVSFSAIVLLLGVVLFDIQYSEAFSVSYKVIRTLTFSLLTIVAFRYLAELFF